MLLSLAVIGDIVIKTIATKTKTVIFIYFWKNQRIWSWAIYFLSYLINSTTKNHKRHATIVFLFVTRGFPLWSSYQKSYKDFVNSIKSIWFVFLRSLSCVPYVASFSELSIFDCPSVFSNVYLLYIYRIFRIKLYIVRFLWLKNGLTNRSGPMFLSNTFLFI
jgi:hypothetical protein